jgi:hypothetical protein
MKLVELEILKISYLGNFLSCYMFLGVILKNSLKYKFRGDCYSAPMNQGRAAHDMGVGETLRGFFGRFQASPWP